MIIIDNKLYNLLKLNIGFGAGSNRAFHIYKTVFDADMLNLPFDKLIKSEIFSDEIRERLCNVRKSEIMTVLDDCRRFGITILPIYDERFPDRLRNIDVPPIILYIKGKLPYIDNEPTLCIVGPRHITNFGEKAAFSLSRRLSKAGFVIVGGAAKGGDSAVHTGAISVGGRSVMVTPDGIMTQLKSAKRDLCNDVLKNGCIISESPPYFSATKYHFRIRNRLMSGLSLGVAVVEAGEGSGTLITANHAADQGRDVFVIPGNPTDKAYKGSNVLLRDGAVPLLDTSDILSRYIIEFPEKIDIKKAFTEIKKSKSTEKIIKKSVTDLSKEAILVYNNLNRSTFSLDDLAGLCIDDAKLLSALTELEIEHMISAMPGGLYKITD